MCTASLTFNNSSSAHILYLCVLYGSVPYTALTDWFVYPKRIVFTARYEPNLYIKCRSFQSIYTWCNPMGNRDVNPPTQRKLPVGQGPLINASRSHSDAPQSVGLLWTNDQPDAETSTRQHTTLTIQTCMLSSGIRIRSRRKQGSQTHALDRAATGNGTRSIA
jgi:hypothetical protein